jgi:hypothetical protein
MLSRGSSRLAPVTKAQADAVCPDGKEEVTGRLTQGVARRGTVLAGRRRLETSFNGPFTRAEAVASASKPRPAARRPVPGDTAAIRPAVASQSSAPSAPRLTKAIK